jgi:hypothetical protein
MLQSFALYVYLLRHCNRTSIPNEQAWIGIMKDRRHERSGSRRVDSMKERRHETTARPMGTPSMSSGFRISHSGSSLFSSLRVSLLPGSHRQGPEATQASNCQVHQSSSAFRHGSASATVPVAPVSSAAPAATIPSAAPATTALIAATATATLPALPPIAAGTLHESHEDGWRPIQNAISRNRVLN